MQRAIKDMVQNIISESSLRWTPSDLEKTLSQSASIDRLLARKVIRELIVDGELLYTYHFGSSFVERSYNKPVRISDRIVLKPVAVSFVEREKDVVVQLLPGAAFGTGEHPSTRLALKGVEHVFLHDSVSVPNRLRRVLDIGTGTGVLAISAVLFGAESAVAMDVDPCAICEAKANIRANGLAGRIEVGLNSLETFSEKFQLVLANLRLPTIDRIYPALVDLVDVAGFAVISGIKIHEKGVFLNRYSEKYFHCLWSDTEKDWVGMVLKRVVKPNT